MIIELRPSRYLLSAVLLLHGLALAALWWTALPWAGMVLLALVIAWNAWRELRRLTVDHPHRLSWRDQCWWLQGRQGEQLIAWRGQLLVTPWLLVLPYRHSRGAGSALVLAPDSADAEDLRRLRVQLRFS